MSGRRNRDARRIGFFAAGAWLVLAAIFLVGDSAARQRLRALSSAWPAEVEEARGRIARAAAWQAPSDDERRAWERAETAYEAAVPVGEIGLAFSREVSTLAFRCGIQGLNLSEIQRIRAWEGEPESSEGGYAGNGEPERIQKEYDVAFRCSYGALVRFLSGLDETSMLIELRRAKVTGAFPLVDVRMVLAAHGRTQ